MTIEPFTPGDLPALEELQPEGWSDITLPFRFYLSKPYCSPRKAVIDGKLAGTGVAIAFARSGWLAHIIVRPEYRQQGIGGRIVSDLLRLLAAKDCRTVSLIATSLGRPVYLKAGFADQIEYVFHARVGDALSAAGEDNIVPFASCYAEAVLALDRETSGEERGMVIAERLPDSFLFVRADQVEGAYLPALGEGLILARDPAAGAALLGLKLARSERFVLPAANTAGLAFLNQNGFRERERCWRMVYGTPFAWKPENIYSRIAGNMG